MVVGRKRRAEPNRCCSWRSLLGQAEKGCCCSGQEGTRRAARGRLGGCPWIGKVCEPCCDGACDGVHLCGGVVYWQRDRSYRKPHVCVVKGGDVRRRVGCMCTVVGRKHDVCGQSTRYQTQRRLEVGSSLVLRRCFLCRCCTGVVYPYRSHPVLCNSSSTKKKEHELGDVFYTWRDLHIHCI